ncbi:MAG: hypothetical protein AAFR90_09985, partial [Pseudomonadota bacterium]
RSRMRGPQVRFCERRGGVIHCAYSTPELHLGRAELAYARGDGAGRHAALAKAIAVIRDGWWVHLPRLAALVDAGGCDDLRPALASLKTAAADYQTQADARWQEIEDFIAGRERQEWAAEDTLLADPARRARCAEIMQAIGHDLEAAPLDEQRQMARAFIQKVEQPGSAPQASDPGEIPDPASLSDEQLDALLTNDQFREALIHFRAANDADFDRMSSEVRRDAARQFFAHLQQQQAGAQPPANDALNMPDLPDEALDQVLADDQIRTMIEQALKASGIDAPLDQMPREDQRRVAALTLAAIQQAQADATGGQPAMPSDKAPAAASPPVPEAPSASEPDDTASAARATRSLLSRIFGRR